MNTRLLVYIVLQALCLMYFLLSAGTFNSLGMVLPSMVEAFGMSWAQAGFGFTLLGTACGIVSLAPALTIRKLGVGRTLALGTVLLFLAFALLYTAQGVWSYYLATTLLGIGYCFCGTVPAVHVLSSTFRRRSTVLGLYFTIGNLGAVAGPLLWYGTQSAGFDWRFYWLLFAVASVFVGGFCTLTAGRLRLHAPQEQAPTPGGPVQWTVRSALGTVQFWVVVFAYTACLAINTTTHSFAYQHLMEHGIGADRASQLISLSALVCAIGSALAGVAGEKTPARVLTMVSLGCLGVSAATLALADGPLSLILWMVAFGGGLGFSYVGTAMLLQSYFGQRAALELYSIMMAVSTSAAIGPALGGAIRDQTGSFAGIFYALAALSAVLLCAVAVLRKPGERTAATATAVAAE
ncbi:CynX/NimT family MFS transporter [Novosphingobium resinovorum]|uniref:MFS transporter n=1 Tax=Novosphingobium resinovorum TaxID=158500 RepID=UPI002ED682F5|nr:MFS transporter [Novosphingobium resinovorum]